VKEILIWRISKIICRFLSSHCPIVCCLPCICLWLE
jgi:hypothetical protein